MLLAWNILVSKYKLNSLWIFGGFGFGWGFFCLRLSVFWQLPTVIARERVVFLLRGFDFIWLFILLFFTVYSISFSSPLALMPALWNIPGAAISVAPCPGLLEAALLLLQHLQLLCPLSYCNINQIIFTISIISFRKGDSAADKPSRSLFAAAKELLEEAVLFVRAYLFIRKKINYKNSPFTSCDWCAREDAHARWRLAANHTPTLLGKGDILHHHSSRAASGILKVHVWDEHIPPCLIQSHPPRILHMSYNSNHFPFIGLYTQVMTTWGSKHLRGCFRP